ncbi:MAG TPA: hypothetical protein VET65_08225 [Candidatus Limnocylindrales bacterium]|nr:hypothetical protein [Candidatus Limnocylindrales bacterium]
MPSPRQAAPVALALLVASSALGTTGSAPVSAAASIGFEVPAVADPIHTNGEPDIAVDPSGRVFVSGPTGTGTQRSTWLGSVDGGHTYRVISPGPPPSPAQSFKDPPGGGDTDINFDRSGKQYFADLYALACVRTATTGDGGATVNESVTGGCDNATSPGADRQWLAVYDPAPGTASTSAYTGPLPLIYLEYNNLAGPGPNGGAQWNKSNALVDPQPGGPGLNYVNALANAPNGTGAVYTPFGPDGYPAIDQVTGQVLQAAGYQDPNTGAWSLRLNIGTPNAAGDLTFLDAPTAKYPQGDPGQLIVIKNNLPASPDTLFSVLSMDSARNLMIAYALGAPTTNPTQRQVFVSAASAASGWKTWSDPVQVSDGSSATGDAVNVFPWIKAGGPGRADAVWYGSNLAVDPSSHNQQAWNVFMNQVVFPTDATGAVTGAPPSMTLVRVSPHPSHYDDICLQGTNCVLSTGNRNLADFFAVTIDRSGAAEVVYDDTSNGLIQSPIPTSIPQVADHAGAPVVSVARQSSGPGLFGTIVTGPSNAPVSGLPDPAGDARYPVIGGVNQPGMDIRNSQLSLSADLHTLTVTMQVVDLAHPAATIAALSGSTNVQYVTRWQMGNTIYYAAMETGPAGRPSFYAGKAQSIDLCSVSACFPHVTTYPEPGAGPTFTGSPEPGRVSCPQSPSAANPCTLTIAVDTQGVGAPTATSLLEEVGGYALAQAGLEGSQTNASAQADSVPLQVDGVCCYNFQAAVANGGPPPCHVADGDGDVSDGRGGRAHVHVDQDGCEDGGTEGVQASDSSTGDTFQSTRVDAVTFDDALHTMTVAGAGTHNGYPVGFTLTAVDGVAGVGGYVLTLSDGYTISGTLLDGAVQLH